MTKKHKPKARQIIISQMLEKVRRDVIAADLELNFLRRLESKIFANEIKLENMSDVTDGIRYQQDLYVTNLERLNYLKELRNTNKIKNILSVVENSTPESIEVEIVKSV